MRITVLAVSGMAALWFAPHHALAHDLERTQVSLTFSEQGSFTLEVANDPNWLLLRLAPFADLPLTGPLTPEERDRRLVGLGPVFVDRVVLWVDGLEVRPTDAQYIPPRPQGSADTRAPLATFRLRGPMPAGARQLQWFYGLVVDPYPLTIRQADGRSTTRWVNGDAWSGPLDLTGAFRPPSPWAVAQQYLRLGYTHIVPKGLDHILFVLGIFLLSLKLGPILMQVTAFTVAHSITLGLAMYGIVSLPPQIVEPLIALSIAYVAVENLVTTELKPWRVALVFSFGLLHGMGFAGVLQELGLPRSQFATALVTFNLGVEAGQLTVIALAGACVVWYRHRDWYRSRVIVPASMVIATVGVYWTIARMAGV